MPIISGGSGSGGAPTLGSSTLIYRFTVVGSSKANIDTGVDTPDAGLNIWTGGDLLEVFLSGQTASASVQDSVNVTVNNDSGANYDRQFLTGANVTASANQAVAQTSWAIVFRGSGGLANQSGSLVLTIPNYAGTTFNKSANALTGSPDSTGANENVVVYQVAWRSAAAITRMKVVGTGGNLAVGTQLSIYKRSSS